MSESFTVHKNVNGHINLIGPQPDEGRVAVELLSELLNDYNKLIDVSIHARRVVEHENGATDDDFDFYVDALADLATAMKAL